MARSLEVGFVACVKLWRCDIMRQRRCLSADHLLWHARGLAVTM